jgi:hypothetical protein
LLENNLNSLKITNEDKPDPNNTKIIFARFGQRAGASFVETAKLREINTLKVDKPFSKRAT